MARCFKLVFVDVFHTIPDPSDPSDPSDSDSGEPRDNQSHNEGIAILYFPFTEWPCKHAFHTIQPSLSLGTCHLSEKAHWRLSKATFLT